MLVDEVAMFSIISSTRGHSPPSRLLMNSQVTWRGFKEYHPEITNSNPDVGTSSVAVLAGWLAIVIGCELMYVEDGSRFAVARI